MFCGQNEALLGYWCLAVHTYHSLVTNILSVTSNDEITTTTAPCKCNPLGCQIFIWFNLSPTPGTRPVLLDIFETTSPFVVSFSQRHMQVRFRLSPPFQRTARGQSPEAVPMRCTARSRLSVERVQIRRTKVQDFPVYKKRELIYFWDSGIQQHLRTLFSEAFWEDWGGGKNVKQMNWINCGLTFQLVWSVASLGWLCGVKAPDLAGCPWCSKARELGRGKKPKWPWT